MPAGLAGNPTTECDSTCSVRDVVANAPGPRYLALDAVGGAIQHCLVQLLQPRSFRVSTPGFEYARVRLQRGDPGLDAWLNKRLLQRGLNGLQLNAGGDVGIGGRCRDSNGRGHSMLQRNLAFRCRS
jgi:hypothetical protein